MGSYISDNQQMAEFGSRWIVLILLTMSVVSARQSIYYLHNFTDFEENTEIQELKNNAYNIPLKIINCLQKNCQKYKVPAQYPQLVLWNGPGCSYKRMQTQTLKSLEEYFAKVNSSPIRPIKQFLQGITLSFGVAFVMGATFYTLFTFLFKDRSGVAEAGEKQKKQ